MVKTNSALVLAGKRRIDVKFTFNKVGYIPNGVQNRWRGTDMEADKRHAENAAKAGNADLGEIGRKREGRVDSGECVIENLDFTQVAMLRRGFANNGFFLTEIFSYQRKGTEKTTLVLRFTPEKPTTEHPSEVIPALRELANLTWGFCYVWDNPDQSVTINLTGRQERKPMNAIVVRDGAITAIPVEMSVGEGEE